MTLRADVPGMAAITLGWLYEWVNFLTVTAGLAAATLTTVSYIHCELVAAYDPR